MADDETTTKKRPAREGESAKRQTRKTEGNDEGNQPTAKRPAPKRSTSAEKPSPRSGSGAKTTDSQGGSATERPANAAERSADTTEHPANSDGKESGKSDGGGSGRKMNTAKAAREAMDQLQALTNRDAEGIVGIEKNDDGGWTVTIEVVESRRIPDTADVLAEYSVTVDAEGDLTEYSRLSRYVRGRTTRGE